ncbi:MAG TPA: TonB-dependent receptor [Steroidobacteraceae bacterium]|nr:TonB-dependent receptor [Steroidobacteraceae bacterium]
MSIRRALLAAATVAGALQLAQAQTPAPAEMLDEVVVTGSILRRTDAETPSPVSVLSAAQLEQRGINTVAEAIQRIPSNNAGTIAQGWNTGNNFAAGATAPALRGLTVQATLSVADGLRLAPYPSSDDGQRNFVDLNTIPAAIIERIEVLRDGASSTYGADAIAGVVNVITKKEIQGLHFGASGALAQEGGDEEQRFDVTWGTGALESDGYNFYVSAEYQKQEALWARDRGYPFNTGDLTRKCGPSGSCLINHNFNGVTPELVADDPAASFNGLLPIPGVALVRPLTNPDAVDGTGAPVGIGRFSLLNEAAGCRQWKTITIDPAQSPTSPLTTCEVDVVNAYQALLPEVDRAGVSMKFTRNLSDAAQFYAMGNFYRTDVSTSYLPGGFNGRPPLPRPANLANYNVILPVYVCSAGIGTSDGLNTGCDDTNGSLNPYNPYAAAGQRAQVLLGSPFARTIETTSRATRGVVGVDGSFAEGWRYSFNATASEVALQRDEGRDLIPQRIMDVVARGTFNFADPAATPQDVWDYIAPLERTNSTSRLWQLQATLSHDIVELPGGALQAAVGAAYREESIDSPSANPANDSAPYTRYYGLNAVGTSGSREVKSAFFEVDAPVLEQLDLLASGRFDKYSTGQSNFSPKLGLKFTPIEQISVRGTWSKGFRIPSFNESFGLPTTGFVARQVDCARFADFCAAHGNNAYATGQYSLGLTQVGNPDLDPEESTSFTAGLVIAPTSNFSVTLDYWNIQVDNLITGVTNTGAAEDAYYANNGVVDLPGLKVIPGTPDSAFPNALPVLGFIQSSFTNQNKETVSGIDIGATVTLPIGERVTWVSSLEGSYLQKYQLETEDGNVLRYDGTLSPCSITSCSGAPKWRGSWQNTFEFGDTNVTLTGYYTSGYDTASIDFDGVRGDCLGNAAGGVSTVAYVDGTPANCRSKAIWNADLSVRHQFQDKYTVYMDVLNVFDTPAPFDPSAAYSIFQFNPAWAGPNILGRYFRLGAKIDL